MRLLVDAHVLDGKFQGTRTYIEGLYTHLVKHSDINFYFAAQDTANLLKVFGERENVHFVRLKTSNNIRRLALEYPSIIKKLGIDIAHFQYISPLIKTCKEIVTIHDLLFLDYPQYFPLTFRLKNGYLFKRSAKRADLLLTVSAFSKREIMKYYNIPQDRIFLTPNGILPPPLNIENIDVKSKYGLDKYVMTVGRIEPRKNNVMLLKAFVEMELRQKGYKLVMVGVIDLATKEFESYYNGLNEEIKKNILIFSAPYPDLVALYRSASLFVFPSLAEGFGIPPLEAAQFGCPVLCSNTTAMADFEFFGNCLFSPDNIEELKEKIHSVLFSKRTDKIDFTRIVKDKYNWSVTADYLYNLIKSI